MKKLRQLRGKYRDELKVGARVVKAAANAALTMRELKGAAPAALVRFVAEAVEGIADGDLAYHEFLMGWERIGVHDFMVDTLKDVFDATPKRDLSNQGSSHLKEFSIDGIKFRYTEESTYTGALFCHESDVEQVGHVLRRLFWAKYQGCVMLVPHMTSRYGAQIRAGDLSYARPTGRGTEAVTKLRKYLAAGKTRALLFKGAAGTGKTTCAAFIAKSVGKRVLVIRPDTLASMRGIYTIVDSTRPDVVLIDELDRSESQSAQMSTWEALRRRCPVILATVNHTDKLDFAMLRPGRFDEVLEFNGIPAEVRAEILATLYSAEMRTLYERNTGIELTAAYLDEWVKRCNIETPDAMLAQRYLEDLHCRQTDTHKHTEKQQRAEYEAVVEGDVLETRPITDISGDGLYKIVE